MTHSKSIYKSPPLGSLRKIVALERLMTETVQLSHRLRRVSEQIHGAKEMSAARRGVLRELEAAGPQTVPQIARARPVSRQHIQIIVNQLLDEGLVKLVPNPAHRRSQLVALTDKGRSRLEMMSRSESQLLAGIEVDISERDLQQATEILQRVRNLFDRSKLRNESE